MKMEKEIITTKQAIAMLFTFIIGTSLIHDIQTKADQDFWIAYLFVIIVVLFFFFVYSRILTLFPQKNLLDINTILFGKIAGSIIYSLFVLYAFSLGAFVTRHIAEYFQIIHLPETPQYAFAICVILVSIYIVKNGIETLGRWCLFSMPIIIFIFLLTIVFSFNIFHPENLKPVFQSNIFLIAENAHNTFILPFGECVVFLLLFDSLQDSKKTLKVFYIGMAIGTTMILLALFRNIMILGVENNMLLFSPSIGAVSVIQLGTLIDRIEVIVSIIFIICGLAKVTFCLMGACKGTAKLLNLDTDRPLVAPLGLLMLMLNFNVFENIMHLSEWFNVYKIYTLPVQIIFPILIWITAEIRTKLKTSPNS